MSALIEDLRHSFRRLRREPAFTVVCILTLALGIGANTAIFNLIHTVMLKSLPVANPAELYRIGDRFPCCVVGGFQDSFSIFSWPFYQQIRNAPEFTDLAAFDADMLELGVRRAGSPAAARPFHGEFVSGNYFRTFGVSAFTGRMLAPTDDMPSAPPAVVMSYRAWTQYFGGDLSAIGSTLTMNEMAYTVVGVAPPGFFGETLRSDPPDFWLPIQTEPALRGKNSILHDDDGWLYLIGRLKPGASPSEVQSRLTVELRNWLGTVTEIPAQYRKEIPRQYIRLTPAGAGITRMRDQFAYGLRLLLGISGLVLLIACANIANLLLARGAAARSEIAVRIALGAPRRRLIGQALGESILLGVLGGAAGLLIAFAGARTILLLAFRGARFVPIAATPSWSVLGFALALSVVTGIVFGIAPAWTTSAADPAEGLRGAGRSIGDRSPVLRRSLVIGQVALSLVLMIGAGLLTRTLGNLEGQQFGFQTRGRLIVRVDPALAGYTPEKLYPLYRQLEERLPNISGVISASISQYSPMSGNNWSSGISILGRRSGERMSSSWDRVGPHYFETVGTRLLRGRAIDERDTPSSPHVAVVSDAFVRRFFPNENPLGKRFGIGDAGHAGDFEIVGVAEDARYRDARDEPWPTAFLPLLQMIQYDGVTEVRSHYIGDIELHVAGRPEQFEPEVRRVLAGINPDLTVLGVRSFEEQVARNFNQDRLMARLTMLFGGLALLLACIGLYGVTAYSVTRRRSEIGVRMALGAGRGRVLGMVLRGVFLQLGIGVAVGIPAALAGGRLLASRLYGVKSSDPMILAGAVLVLAASALAAGLIPARRAATIDPMQALRVE